MEFSKSAIKSGKDIKAELKDAEIGDRVIAGTFDGIGGPYTIHFVRFNSYVSGFLHNKNNSIVLNDNCYSISDVDAFIGVCSESYSNFSKYVLAYYKSKEDRDRMFITYQNAKDISTRNGWWETFCLADTAPSVPGLYICHIVSYHKDRNGYPLVVVHPVEYVADDSYGKLVLNALLYADVYARSHGRYTNFHGVYSESASTIQLELYGKNKEWIAGYDWDTFYNKLSHGQIKPDDWKAIYDNLNSPTSLEIEQKENRETVLRLAKENPVIFKKIADDSGLGYVTSKIDDYIYNISDRYSRMFSENPYNKTIEERILMVEKRAAELKAAKKAKATAEKKAKKAALKKMKFDSDAS